MIATDWNKLLDEESTDWELRCIYADWLEDCGRVVESGFQRWLVEHKKAPYKSLVSRRNYKGGSWDFWLDANIPHDLSRDARYLDIQIFDALNTEYKDIELCLYKEYPTRQIAENHLMKALIELGEL